MGRSKDQATPLPRARAGEPLDRPGSGPRQRQRPDAQRVSDAGAMTAAREAAGRRAAGAVAHRLRCDQRTMSDFMTPARAGAPLVSIVIPAFNKWEYTF